MRMRIEYIENMIYYGKQFGTIVEMLRRVEEIIETH